VRQAAGRLVLALATLAGIARPMLAAPGSDLAGNATDRPRAVASMTTGASATSAYIEGAPRRAAIVPKYPDASKRTALVIGINHAAGSPTLHGAVRDAEMLHEALHRYGFLERNIVVLTEHAATASRILTELDSLAARTPIDGRAVFAFAGHTRQRGGVNRLVAADGGLVSAPVLATRLSRVRAPMWVALPTCFSAAYAYRGIVGANRIATFASSGNRLAYELGSSGSWLMLYMVQYAMLDGRAPVSIERSFEWARDTIEQKNPDRVPFMRDGFKGEFSLGPVGWSNDAVVATRRAPARSSAYSQATQTQSGGQPQPAQQSSSNGQAGDDQRHRRGIRVCFGGCKN
jgi:hypothetical protein